MPSPFRVDPFGDFGKPTLNSTLCRVMPISDQDRGFLSIKTNLTSLFWQAQYLGLHFRSNKLPDWREERPDHVPKPAPPPVPCFPPGHGRNHEHKNRCFVGYDPQLELSPAGLSPLVLEPDADWILPPYPCGPFLPICLRTMYSFVQQTTSPSAADRLD